MERPGVEPATSRSQVQRPNHYTTEPLYFTLHESSILLRQYEVGLVICGKNRVPGPIRKFITRFQIRVVDTHLKVKHKNIDIVSIFKN